MSPKTPSTDDVDLTPPALALAASGLLREFNRAGILDAADVHVARRLGQLAGETAQDILLAAALAVRAPRLGHVLVDLATIRETAAVETEEAPDLAQLSWPEPAEWVARVASSRLVAGGPSEADERGEGETGGGTGKADEADEAGEAGEANGAAGAPLRLSGSRLYLDRYWAEEAAVAAALRDLAGAAADGVNEATLRDGLARLFGRVAAASSDTGSARRDGHDARHDEDNDEEDEDDGPARAGEVAARRRLAVIAGGPGTGKTTTVARIAALLCEQARAAGRRLPLIALAAPTGKAAARLQEAVRAEAAGLDTEECVRRHLLELPAVTIHRLLGWRPGSASRFRHDRSQRLPHDAVIVDETSMVSLSLMARLIEALRSDARLILIGDPGQLASIEAGAVLGDIVSAGRPGGGLSGETVVLRRVHRFGGEIARLAEAIRAGDADATLTRLRQDAATIRFLELDGDPEPDPEAVLAPALDAARTMVSAAQRGDPARALDALSRCRILCAHRRGPTGVSGWTSRIETRLAAELPELDPEDRWYVGRPLLVTENDYELRLNNGDIGVIVAGPDERVRAVFDRGGVPLSYSPSRLGAVETVYAMTIHKSQGSQFELAAVLLPEPGSRLLTRELLYTAVTRAQRQLIVVGSEASVRAAVQRPVARASGLALRLRAGRPPAGGRPGAV
jgi:exodeoxyribonuclease V alpha subunit